MTMTYRTKLIESKQNLIVHLGNDITALESYLKNCTVVTDDIIANCDEGIRRANGVVTETEYDMLSLELCELKSDLRLLDKELEDLEQATDQELRVDLT
jgi:hypothetical protein